MTFFKCPVCGGSLKCENGVYACYNRHSFDKASAGYVNLLMSNSSSLKRHGDDKLMVRSRRDFLNGGYYEPLKTAVLNACKEFSFDGVSVCDVGCGEGYFTDGLKDALPKSAEIFGIDISKDALKYAAKRCKGVSFAVASAFLLPFFDASADIILNIFAPCAYSEFSRVLKDGGVLIKAVPLSMHLWELKRALYDEPYRNKPEITGPSFFEIKRTELKYEITLDSKERIFELFSMTPYFYKTSREDAQKLLSLEKLTTTVHFGVEIYKKGVK